MGLRVHNLFDKMLAINFHGSEINSGRLFGNIILFEFCDLITTFPPAELRCRFVVVYSRAANSIGMTTDNYKSTGVSGAGFCKDRVFRGFTLKLKLSSVISELL